MHNIINVAILRDICCGYISNFLINDFQWPGKPHILCMMSFFVIFLYNFDVSYYINTILNIEQEENTCHASTNDCLACFTKCKWNIISILYYCIGSKIIVTCHHGSLCLCKALLYWVLSMSSITLLISERCSWSKIEIQHCTNLLTVMMLVLSIVVITYYPSLP